MTQSQDVASGVQELIRRLRDEGVEAGEQRADEILREAEAKAARLVADARAEADDILRKGRLLLEREQASAKAAIQVAIRDTSLDLAEELKAVFAGHVRRLVAAELKDREFLRHLILSIAGRAGQSIPDGHPLEVLIGKESLVANGDGKPALDRSGDGLRQFVLGVSGAMLREGVALRPAGSPGAGIRVKMVGEDLEIDLTDKALSDLILKHLLPRYRKIVEGIE